MPGTKKIAQTETGDQRIAQNVDSQQPPDSSELANSEKPIRLSQGEKIDDIDQDPTLDVHPACDEKATTSQ